MVPSRVGRSGQVFVVITFRMGNEPGKSFRIKAANLEVVSQTRFEKGRYSEGRIPQFQRIAVAFSGQTSNRVFILEPFDSEDWFYFGSFFIQGPYKVVRKYNHPKKAAEVWKTFVPK